MVEENYTQGEWRIEGKELNKENLNILWGWRKVFVVARVNGMAELRMGRKGWDVDLSNIMNATGKIDAGNSDDKPS